MEIDEIYYKYKQYHSLKSNFISTCFIEPLNIYKIKLCNKSTITRNINNVNLMHQHIISILTLFLFAPIAFFCSFYLIYTFTFANGEFRFIDLLLILSVFMPLGIAAIHFSIKAKHSFKKIKEVKKNTKSFEIDFNNRQIKNGNSLYNFSDIDVIKITNSNDNNIRDLSQSINIQTIKKRNNLKKLIYLTMKNGNDVLFMVVDFSEYNSIEFIIFLNYIKKEIFFVEELQI